jgi:hypothetical protein
LVRPVQNYTEMRQEEPHGGQKQGEEIGWDITGIILART